MNEGYNGVYRGIIIQNDDEFAIENKMGRVKVFVPHISMTLYEGWNKEITKDKTLNALGKLNAPGSTDPDIAEFLERLKQSLPWCEVMQPVFGSGSSGMTISEKGITTNENSPYVLPKTMVTPIVPPEIKEEDLPPPAVPSQSLFGPSNPIQGQSDAQSIKNAQEGEGNTGNIADPNYKPQLKDNPTNSGINFDPKSLEPTPNPSAFTQPDSSNATVVEPFNMSIHYNRDGTIRSFSKSSNINVNINSRGEILITDPITKENRLALLPKSNTTVIDSFFSSTTGSKPNTLQAVNAINQINTTGLVSQSDTITVQNTNNGSYRAAEAVTINESNVNAIEIVNGEAVIFTEAATQPFNMSIHYNRNGTIRSFSKSDNINVITTSSGQINILDNTNNRPLMELPAGNQGTIINSLFSSSPGSKPSQLNTINTLGQSAITPSILNQSNINNYTVATGSGAVRRFNNSVELPSGPGTISEPSLFPSGSGGTGTSGGTGSALATKPNQITMPPAPIIQDLDHQGTPIHTDDYYNRTDKDPKLSIGQNTKDNKTLNTYGEKQNQDPNETAGVNTTSNKLPDSSKHSPSVPNHSNKYKGMVSIPEPGAHVWVKYENGDPLYPIIVGYMVNKENILEVFDYSEQKT